MTEQEKLHLFNDLYRDIGTLVELATAAKESDVQKACAERLDANMAKLQAEWGIK